MEEEESEVSENETEEPEVTEAEEPREAAPDFEEEARGMGWVPKDDFRGDPDNWRPAEEFVKRGKEFIPFLRKDNEKLKGQLDELRTKLDSQSGEFKETVENLKRMNDIALEQQRQQLVSQYRAKKEQAVEHGDVEAYRVLDEQESKALSDLDEKVKPPSEPGGKKEDALPPQVQATIDTWVADNAWFNSDSTMRAVANAHHEKLMADKPGLSLAENLSEVRDEVRRRFPEKFGKVAPNGRGSPVESGARNGKAGGGGLWTKLPKEVQEIADKQIKEGQFRLDAEGNEIKEVAQRKERYAQLYLEG